MKRTAITLFALSLCLLGGNALAQFTLDWEVHAGDPAYAWLGEATNTNTSLVYNPDTGNLLVNNRGNDIYIVDSDDGSVLGTLNTTGTTGSLKFNKVRVADDGAIFAVTLATAAGTLTIYRWENEAAEPTTITGEVGARTGDSFAVTGAGEDTRLYASGSNNANIYVFTTEDGTTFSIDTDATIDVGLGNARGAISPVTDGSHWMTGSGQTVRRVDADGTVLSNSDAPTFYHVVEFLGFNRPHGPEKFLAMTGRNLTAGDAEGLTMAIYSATDSEENLSHYADVAMTRTFVANVNATADIATRANPDGSFTFFQLVTNNGFASFTATDEPIGPPTLLLTEAFEYPTGTELNADTDWTRHSGIENQIVVSDTPLSYPDYWGSNRGGSAQMVTAHTEDIHRNIPQQTGDDVYASMLVNVESVSIGGDYFFHMGPDPLGTFFRVRTFVRRDAENSLAFGISFSSNDPDWTGFDFDLNTTYLIVVRYRFVEGEDNDEAAMWINPELDGPMPAPDLTNSRANLGLSGDHDLSNVGSIALRNGAGGAPTMLVDAIRVATTWEEAPLPVELVSFDAIAEAGSATLRWTTASERNNAGFEIQRRTGDGFSSIGFVEGAGNSDQPREYSYTVRDLSPGTHAFRLRQVDFDGSFSYSAVIEVSIELAGQFELSGAYPNPFNPQTSFRLTVAQEQHVTINVYDVLGRRIATLHDGTVPANETQTFTFTAGDLSSGLYFYRVEGETFAETRRMTLLK